MRKVLVALSVSLPLAAMTGACTQVPGLDVETESVRIIDIVKRVKCDIYDAFTEDTADGRRKLISDREGYKWLDSWTAQVDLNLLVNNQSGLTPGVTIVDPLHQVAIPRVGTFSQSFTMGLGGGLNTTAARTETITFSLSVREIEAELRNPSHKSWAYQNCQFENGPGLRSDLKLKEWIASALAPADTRRPYLTVGHHKSPRSSSSSGTRKAGSKVQGGAGALSVRMLSMSAQEDRKPVSDALKAVSDVMNKIRALKGGLPGDQLNREINQTIEMARAALRLIKDDPSQKGVREHLRVAEITLTWIVRFSTLSRRQDLPQSQIARLIDQLATDIDEISTFATTREIEEALKTLQEGKSELELVIANLDPPIDSISHQVQFVLALNGNASPGWSLVRFKGPSPNNGLVGGSHSNTHTLTIVMGASPNEVSNKLNSLQIGTNIGNALNTTTIRVAPVQ
jgi:hypothetical protein